MDVFECIEDLIWSGNPEKFLMYNENFDGFALKERLSPILFQK